MADDKGAKSSGGDWSALEIIIGVILAIALLDRLTGNTYKISKAPAVAPAIIEQEKASTCGLTIIRPKPLEKVRDFVTVGGTVGSCDWKSSGDIALYAQLIDSRGKPVSLYTKILPSQVVDGVVSFMQTIELTDTPASGTGYLILIPAVSSDAQRSLSNRIPLTFLK